MHKIIPQEGNVVRVEVSGRLTQSDYDQLIPSWEALIARHGKMRLLFVMHDFHGWEPQAAWEDFRLISNTRRAWSELRWSVRKNGSTG